MVTQTQPQYKTPTAKFAAMLNAMVGEPTHHVMTPYALGVLDAQRGELCVPEMYFVKRRDMREYAQGFESVAGRTLLSGQLLGSGPCTDAQIDQLQYAAEADMERLLGVVTVTDVDATIDEVFGKPQLGVEDSGGLYDDDEPWPLLPNERMVNYCAEADDYEDFLADVEFIRGGC